MLDGIKRSLEQNKLQFAIYDGVATEPTGEIVREGIKAFQDNGCDFLLAVGGGSPIDTAKAIAVMVTNPVRLRIIWERAKYRKPECL